MKALQLLAYVWLLVSYAIAIPFGMLGILVGVCASNYRSGKAFAEAFTDGHKQEAEEKVPTP